MQIKISLIFLFSSFILVSCFENPDNTIVEKKEPVIIKSSTSKLDSLIKENPKNANLYYQRSKISFDKNFQPKALVDILSAIKLDSSNADYYLLGGEIFIKMGQGNEAKNLISKGINMNPKNEDLYLRIVEYEFYLKNYKSSLTFVNDLLKINKNNADAYFFKGLILRENNMRTKAISNFQTCVEQDPTYYNSYMQLATIFSEDKNELALKYYDNALKLNPKSREALYGKGFFYQEKKQYNLAKENYKQMIINNQRDFQAFYNMGHCFIAQDSIKKADNHFYRALKIKPDYVDAIYMQGQIAERIGNIPSAKIHYQNALKLLPNNETILESLRQIQ